MKPKNTLIDSICVLVVLLVLTHFSRAQENPKVFNLAKEVEWPGEIPGPDRLWTPRNSTDSSPGFFHGPPFRAKLCGVFNEDTQFSKEFAIFELSDGRTQGYQTRSFCDADRVILHEFKKQMPIEHMVPVDYQPDPSDMEKRLFHAHQIDRLETPHFSFWYGHTGKDVNGKLMSDPTFLPKAASWYEKIWNHFAVEVGAPMPHANEVAGKKINVVVCCTGYPGADGYANSAESMALAPIGMQYGSSVVPHEFTHVIQFYSGGFRESPSVGYFWETHANFGAFTYEPTTTYDVEGFFSNLEKGVQWSKTRYSNWPYLMHLYEKRRTRPLVFDIWTKNGRDAHGNTLEDPLETLVRVGQEAGSLPQGWASLGDEWGEFAQRLVNWDYIHHSYYEPATRDARQKAYVQLAPNAHGYDSPADRPLRAYGIHFIHLHAVQPGGVVQVDFTGKSAAQKAAWRVGLVAVNAAGVARYSVLKRASDRAPAHVELPIHDGEEVTLVVAAIPNTYLSVKWGELPPNVFPYSLQVTNAKL